MSILIKGALLDSAVTDVYIEKKEIRQIGADLQVQADQVIDGRRKALIPGFVNAHTHAAMTLFRGFGDDMPLMPWLEQKEMGLRALLSGVCFDHFKPELAEKSKRENEKLVVDVAGYGKRIRYAIGPHAIYTVSGELLQWIHGFAAEHSVPIHLHLAETEGEVRDSVKQFGLTPVRYLYKLGILSPRLIIAHGIYVDDDEIRMLADHGVKVVHNPASNMKLASGIQFKFCEMRKAGVTVALGTDGCSSSNNLDMVEAMKLASLLGKAWRKDPEAIPAGEIFQAATEAGASAIGLKAGRIAEGYLADLCLVDLNIPAFTPNHNFVSNLVYAANGSCIDTVICDGKILMQDKKVPGEEEIMERTAELAYKLVREP